MPARSLLTFAAASALTLSALAVPAGASVPAVRTEPVSRIVLTDPVGDVWALSEGENAVWALADGVPDVDVTRAVVKHGRRNLVVRTAFADLRREHEAGYWVSIRSSRKFRAAFVLARPGRWRGQHRLVDNQFGNVRCRGLAHTIDYDSNIVTIKVPRSCLGRPAWVRVSVENASFREASDGTFQELSDNPHNTGHDAGLTRRLYHVG
jgi:hypothetical protein